MAGIQTDYKELLNFARALRKFADEIEYQIKKLKNETDAVTSYSWRGRQADEFSCIVDESKENMDKQIAYLRDLAEAIDDKAEALRIATSRKMGN